LLAASAVEELKTQTPAPTLPAYAAGAGWVVFCDHCRAWHRHAPEPGPRVAHCFRSGSPYAQAGYILAFAGPLTDKVRREHGQQRKSRGMKL
jgi:hypothetical protein